MAVGVPNAQQAGGFLGLGASSAGELIGTLIGKIPLLAISFFVLFLSYVLAKFCGRMVRKSVLRQEITAASYAADMLGRSTYYFVMAIGITVALKVVNIDISVIMGALTFGLGFAMQDMISNYIAGIWILLSQMFKIGDLVEIPGINVIGTVERIETRSTELRTFDGQKVVVPNSVIFREAVVDYSTYSERRVVIEVGLHYETNLQLAREVVARVLDTDPRVLQYPNYVLQFNGFKTSAINMQVKFWIDPQTTDYFTVYSDILQQVKVALDEVGIVIPFPMRTIVFENTAKRSTGDKQKLSGVTALDPAFISEHFPSSNAPAPKTAFDQRPSVPAYAAAPASGGAAPVTEEVPLEDTQPVQEAGAPQEPQPETPQENA